LKITNPTLIFNLTHILLIIKNKTLKNMNPELNMSYRFKYLALGLITYVVTTYA